MATVVKRIGAEVLTVWCLSASLFLWGCKHAQEEQTPSLERPPSPVFSLAPEVDAILRNKLELLQPLVQDPQILAAVRTANQTHAKLDEAAIEQLERRFQNEPLSSPFLHTLLETSAAEVLKTFQKKNPGFAAIFVTDRYGLIVAATNKTTNYYQAGEHWWRQTFRAGCWYGAIEYDESSQTEAVPLYVLIRDPTTAEPLGTLKAVFRLEAIIEEL